MRSTHNWSSPTNTSWRFVELIASYRIQTANTLFIGLIDWLICFLLYFSTYRHKRIRALTVPSASAEMTLPRAERDLLIFLASSKTAPSAPVLLTWKSREREKGRRFSLSRHTEGCVFWCTGQALCTVHETGWKEKQTKKIRRWDLFTSSQIHQIELPTQLLLRLYILLLDVNQEDAVTARAVLVHVWTSDGRVIKNWFRISENETESILILVTHLLQRHADWLCLHL